MGGAGTRGAGRSAGDGVSTVLAAAATVVLVGLALVQLRWSARWLAVPLLAAVAAGWAGLAHDRRRRSATLAGALALLGVGAGWLVPAFVPPTAPALAAEADQVVAHGERWEATGDRVVPWAGPTVEYRGELEVATAAQAVAALASRMEALGYDVEVRRPAGGGRSAWYLGESVVVPVWDLVGRRAGVELLVATGSDGPDGDPGATVRARWSAPVLGSWPYGDEELGGGFSAWAAWLLAEVVLAVAVWGALAVGALMALVSLSLGARAVARSRPLGRPSVEAVPPLRLSRWRPWRERRRACRGRSSPRRR